MLQAWHTSGASTWAGYILGFPGDTRESILRDMEIIKKELPLDILELFMLTPLPGSEDHQTLWKKGVWMDPDLNKYDLHHRVVHHPKMSDAEYEQTYRDAWKTYYTPEHIETVARRHGADPRPQSGRAGAVHDHVQDHVRGRGRPSAGRRHRAPEVPARPPLRHEDRAVRRVPLQAGARELEEDQDLRGGSPGRAGASARTVKNDPKRHEYTDLALEPVVEEEMDKLSLFADTAGGGARSSSRSAARIWPAPRSPPPHNAPAPGRRIAAIRRPVSRPGYDRAMDDEIAEPRLRRSAGAAGSSPKPTASPIPAS